MNAAAFRPGEIARATGGAVFGVDPDRHLRGVATDSRTATEDSLFVALLGENHDGHRFVDEVRRRGAVPLVARGRGIEGPRIEVDDTLVALGQIARAFVDRETAGKRVPVLAIGGAAGKTTTKSLAAAAVGALFGETLVTAGNLNNRIGVPMTLLTLTGAHRAIVLECGTSEPGEIAALGRIARPDVAVVTNVGVEHSLKLGSVEQIADEEAALLFAARRVAVANGDDPLLQPLLARVSAQQLRFGRSDPSDLRLASRSVNADGTSEILFRTKGSWFAAGIGEDRQLRFTTGLLGDTAAMNVGAAVLGALALLDRPPSEPELEALRAAIAEVEAVPGRLRPLAIGDLLVLDDSYNANPGSVRAALAAAREVADRRGTRLVLALGDMLELGALADEEHDAMLRAADSAGASTLLLVGAETGAALKRLARGVHTPHRAFLTSDAAAEELAHVVRPNDLLLVKGSRGMRMERLIETLERNR